MTTESKRVRLLVPVGVIVASALLLIWNAQRDVPVQSRVILIGFVLIVASATLFGWTQLKISQPRLLSWLFL